MSALGVSIRQATSEDIGILAPLFDAYRQFYHQPSDVAGAQRFLLDRLSRNQSVVFLAFAEDMAVGFTQLYPSFSSGAMAPIFILNDLFVAPEGRRRGVGLALLQAAADYAKATGALRLALSTALTNTTAQALYQKAGWKRDTVFCTFELAL